MTTALMAGASALAAGLLLLSLVEYELHQHRKVWQSVKLRFGRDVTEEAVVAMLDSLAGLPRRSTVLVDLVATAAGTAHYLHTDSSTLETVRSSFQALLPSVRLE